tara:strand:- start:6098 stop:7432 length:1335 start_codon:yes stop_codon:yes gene_type:complete
LSILIVNGTVVNEGVISEQDILIKDGRIAEIGSNLHSRSADQVVDAKGKLVLPGMIDDQVHFREPGLSHKGGLATESRAAIAGGITSFFDMPNVKPPTVTLERLEEKFQYAAGKCAGNYAFYLGATNDNADELAKLTPGVTCGIKIFMGASTGNMLVNKDDVLEKIFANAQTVVVTHCEDSPTIYANEDKYREEYGENIPMEMHPKIRSEEACYLSSLKATNLAKKYNTKLQVLHLTTAKELEFFNTDPIEDKQITVEVCAHHLFFSEEDYAQRGGFIKCNPAIKRKQDRDALVKALAEGRIDVVATDHAPHTLAEKTGDYFKTAAGLPLVQYAFTSLLELVQDKKLSIERLVEASSHSVAKRFGIIDRGFLREGYWADIILVDMNQGCTDTPEKVMYKCGWSPFDGFEFRSRIDTTIVNGTIVYANGKLTSQENIGQRIEFLS